MKKHPKHLMLLVSVALITAFTLNRAAARTIKRKGAAPQNTNGREENQDYQNSWRDLVDDYFWLREKSTLP